MIIIILGGPGSGKGTQATLFAEKLNIPAISVGELLRNEVQLGSKIGKEANGYMVSGQWVPADLTVTVLKKRLESLDLSKGFILDAFPRLLEEKKLLEDYLKSKGTQIDRVYNLEVDDDICLERIQGRRAKKGTKKTVRHDESDEVTRKRIALHHRTSKPILQEFKSLGLLVNIDGNKSVEKIHDKIWGDFTNYFRKQK